MKEMQDRETGQNGNMGRLRNYAKKQKVEENGLIVADHRRCTKMHDVLRRKWFTKGKWPIRHHNLWQDVYAVVTMWLGVF